VGRGARLVALIALLLLAPACGGGGGGGGGPTDPSPPQPAITLTPTGGSTNLALAQSARSTTTTLVVEVRAVNVSGLYGVAFDLDYPAGVLRYQALRAGSFLQTGGAQVSTQVFESTTGHLVVGVSRLGNVTGATGTGVLLELELTASQAGTGSFSFTNNSAFNAAGSPLNLSWGGGTVAVVR
jgi:hypothetical protein